MTDLKTWEDKRNWLQNTFAQTVHTTWKGPEDFRSDIKVEISNAQVRSTVHGTGRTGEESVSQLFDKVTNHATNEHIVYGANDTRVTIDPATLAITPWKAPVKTA